MRSLEKTATALGSLHVPVSAAAATTERTETRGHRERVVGAAAIASAAMVMIDNLVVGWVGSPTYGAPIKEVLAFHADHRTAVAIAVGLEALIVIVLGLLLVDRRNPRLAKPNLFASFGLVPAVGLVGVLTILALSGGRVGHG